MKFTLVYDYPNLKKVTCSNNWNYTCSAVQQSLHLCAFITLTVILI